MLALWFKNLKWHKEWISMCYSVSSLFSFEYWLQISFTTEAKSSLWHQLYTILYAGPQDKALKGKPWSWTCNAFWSTVNLETWGPSWLEKIMYSFRRKDGTLHKPEDWVSGRSRCFSIVYNYHEWRVIKTVLKLQLSKLTCPLQTWKYQDTERDNSNSNPA